MENVGEEKSVRILIGSLGPFTDEIMKPNSENESDDEKNRKYLHA